jgi:hypothetical protein
MPEPLKHKVIKVVHSDKDEDGPPYHLVLT